LFNFQTLDRYNGIAELELGLRLVLGLGLGPGLGLGSVVICGAIHQSEVYKLNNICYLS